MESAPRLKKSLQPVAYCVYSIATGKRKERKPGMQELLNMSRDDYERAKALQEAFDSFVHSRIKEWSHEEIELLAKVNVSLDLNAFRLETELERWALAMEKDIANA